MPSAGIPVRTGLQPQTPIAPQYPFGDPNTYSAAVAQQGGDYDRIMKGYQSVFDKGMSSSSNNQNFTPITPQLTQYSPSSNVTSSLSNLSSLASTGGYTPKGIRDIRARSVSPIRSIYANAQQGLSRQKALSGGYSPNFNAASTRMTRDLSEQIAAANTNVEAGIAQNVASNKLAISPTWASAAATEDAARVGVDRENTAITNRTNEFNAMGPLQYRQAQQQLNLAPLEGMKGLYGTTPALVNTFGNDVTQAGQLGQNQQRINNDVISDFSRRRLSMFGA